MKDIMMFLKKRKIKSNHIIANNIKISQKMKNNSQFSIEKNAIKYEKTA